MSTNTTNTTKGAKNTKSAKNTKNPIRTPKHREITATTEAWKKGKKQERITKRRQTLKIKRKN